MVSSAVIPKKLNNLNIFHTVGNLCESSSFLHNYIHSYIDCNCSKRYSQCQWSQVIQCEWNPADFDSLGPWVLILRAQKSSFRAGRQKKGARWLRAVCPSSRFLFAQSCTFCVVVTEEVQVSQTHTIFYLNWREQYYSEWKSLFCMWCNWNSGSKVHREPHSPSKVVSQLTLNWQKKN